MSGHLATHVVKEWLQLKFPYKQRYSLTPSTLKRLKPRFRLWYIITVVLITALILVLPFVFARLAFVFYYPLGKLVVKDGDIFIPLAWPYLMVPGFFITLVTLPYILKYVQKLGLGKNYKYFEDYYNAKKKYDNHKAGIWITRACWYPFIIALLAVGTSGLIVRPSGFSIRHLYNYKWSNYKYKEVGRILCYKRGVEISGSVVEYPHVAIEAGNDRISSIDEFTNDQLFLETLRRKGVRTDSLDIDN